MTSAVDQYAVEMYQNESEAASPTRTGVEARRSSASMREGTSMRIRWRGLELPSRVVRDETLSGPKFGRFNIEPFERGFGTTVGNSLRRILLSSLEGAAVTTVRITGAEHEFCSLEGVLEDVSAVILNIKSLVIRHDGEGMRTARLSAQGRKGEMTEVRADQIACDPTIEIINKDHLIATLTSDVTLAIEFTVEKGRGYRTADENKSEEQVIGVIPIDSAFSPVTRVRYRVEETRVGQRTNYDRLIMDIWTNGMVSPDLALVEAAKILRKHLNPFVQYIDAGEALAMESVVGLTTGGAIDAAMQAKLAMPVAELDLSVRANNCLDSARITTVGDLVQWTEAEMLKLRSFGKTSLREVKRKLADIGLSLGMRSGGMRPPLAAAEDDSPASDDESMD
jgi:DNA-directed RNA polymerase subunit alpha